MFSRLLSHYVLALFTIIVIPLISFAQDTSKLLEDGYGYYQRGEYTKAISIFNKITEINNSSQEDLSGDYINALVYMGSSYYALTEYDRALSHYSQALNLVEKIDGQELYCSALLNCMGTCYVMLMDYTRALDLFQRELAIKETMRKEVGVVDYSACLYNIGLCYSYLENFEKSLDFHLRCLKIRSDSFPFDDLERLESIRRVGQCYKEMGEYNDALKYFNQLLSIQVNNTNGGMDYSQTLEDIAECYEGQNNYEEALNYHQHALRLRENVLRKNHQDCADIYYRIGQCHLHMEHFADALESFRQALSGGEHPLFCSSVIFAMAVAYQGLGDYNDALVHYRKALSLFEKSYGKNHPLYFTYLSAFGNILGSVGDYESELQIALQILATTNSDDSSRYAEALLNVATAYGCLKDYNASLEYAEKARGIMGQLSDDEGVANCLLIIGSSHTMLGNYEKAIDDFQCAAKAFERRVCGKNSIVYLVSLNGVFQLLASTGELEHAQEQLITYFDLAKTYLLKQFLALPEEQRNHIWGHHGFNIFFTNNVFWFACLANNSEMNRLAYDGALFGKGLLLNAEIEMRKLILESGDEEVLKMYEDMRNIQLRLDKLYESPTGKKPIIDSLQQDLETCQQQLMKRSKEFGDYTRNLALKWTDVQSALGKKDIAIEFATYTQQDTTYYIALTLKKGYTEPHLVKLFNNKDLQSIPSKGYYKSTDLTNLVWGKLKEELAGVKNVYFSPSGELNNIGIEYLPDWDGKHILSEKMNYYRLTSTREIVNSHSSHSISDASVYGGIVYDVSPKSKLTGQESSIERLALSASRSLTPIDSLGLTRGDCDFLPGSKVEAEAISAILSSNNIQSDLIEGEYGTEESFKELSESHKSLIHIATHGFYWTERDAEKAADRLGIESFSFMKNRDSKIPKEDKALTRSGLLFAGAKNTMDGREIPIDVEDGILTAKDISRMDLRGTDLVVISACQSGLGDITGDGVFGLQRGFKKAGVQSIIMSLWKVDDDATKIMMTRFYSNLVKGRSKYDSFREAQTYLRKYDKGKFNTPYCYAAFVLLDAID